MRVRRRWRCRRSSSNGPGFHPKTSGLRTRCHIVVPPTGERHPKDAATTTTDKSAGENFRLDNTAPYARPQTSSSKHCPRRLRISSAGRWLGASQQCRHGTARTHLCWNMSAQRQPPGPATEAAPKPHSRRREETRSTTISPPPPLPARRCPPAPPPDHHGQERPATQALPAQDLPHRRTTAPCTSQAATAAAAAAIPAQGRAGAPPAPVLTAVFSLHRPQAPPTPPRRPPPPSPALLASAEAAIAAVFKRPPPPPDPDTAPRHTNARPHRAATRSDRSNAGSGGSNLRRR
jgi:hypothetical protein